MVAHIRSKLRMNKFGFGIAKSQTTLKLINRVSSFPPDHLSLRNANADRITMAKALLINRLSVSKGGEGGPILCAGWASYVSPQTEYKMVVLG